MLFVCIYQTFNEEFTYFLSDYAEARNKMETDWPRDVVDEKGASCTSVIGPSDRSEWFLTSLHQKCVNQIEFWHIDK